MSMNSALAQILAFFKVYLIAWIKYCMYEILQYIMSRDGGRAMGRAIAWERRGVVVHRLPCPSFNAAQARNAKKT
jgi:hypothetical protein